VKLDLLKTEAALLQRDGQRSAPSTAEDHSGRENFRPDDDTFR
jgi:hypothetical protein